MEVLELTETAAPTDWYSSAELKVCINNFSDVDWLRIREAARFLSKNRRQTLSTEEIIGEAILKALSEERRCPKNVSPIVFICNAMKSISSNERVKADNNNLSIYHVGELVDSTAKSEDEIINHLDAKSYLEEIVSIFNDDEECSMLILGLSEELTKAEIMELMSIDDTAYDTIRTRFRRSLKKHFPEGVVL